MTMGHYATVLMPFSRLTNAPVIWLLFCANLPDFLWFGLSIAGVEPMTPPSFLDVSIQTLHADSFYSHGGVWVLLLALVAGAAAFAVTRRKAIALWSLGLVVLHLICDYLSGWEHELFGAGSLKMGLDLYHRSPYLAFLIEAVFSAALVAWYVNSEKRQGRPLTTKKIALLGAVFVGGSLFFIANSTMSMRQLFGL